MNERISKPIKGHWDFPKGHIEKGEKIEDTVKREVKEETGISKIELIPGYKETIKFFIGPKGNRRLKFVDFFIARTKQAEVVISHEHQGYAWLPYEEAYKLVTYSNSKKLFRHAYDFISKKGL